MENEPGIIHEKIVGEHNWLRIVAIVGGVLLFIFAGGLVYTIVNKEPSDISLSETNKPQPSREESLQGFAPKEREGERVTVTELEKEFRNTTPANEADGAPTVTKEDLQDLFGNR